MRMVSQMVLHYTDCRNNLLSQSASLVQAQNYSAYYFLPNGLEGFENPRVVRAG